MIKLNIKDFTYIDLSDITLARGEMCNIVLIFLCFGSL